MVGAAVQGRGDIAGEEEGEGKGESEWGEEKVAGVKGGLWAGWAELGWLGFCVPFVPLFLFSSSANT